MYKLTSYKHGRIANEYTHKMDVLSCFYKDIKNCEASHVEEHKKTISITFCGAKYSCCYLLPLRFKMYFNGELSNFIMNLLLHDNDGCIESMTEEEAKENIKAWENDGVEIPEGLTANDLINGIKIYC